MTLSTILRQHGLAILLISLGTWLRFYQLPAKGILFGDSGHDLLLAAESVEQRQLPLLGIASSVPRFHQGPLTIWLNMVIYSLVGYRPGPYYWVFALLGCMAMIGVYEFSLVKLNKKIGLMALAFLAVSPLAIAHSRMVYHTGPIPLLTVLSLWTLTRVLERRDWSAAWAMLSITLLFQHELSLFPIFLALPLAWWWGGWQLGLKGNQLWKLSRRETAASCVALMIGLLPQLVSEFQNHSGQLSGFGLWLIYRCLSFLNPSSNHFGLTSLSLAITSLSQYASRVFITPQSGWIGIGVMGVLTGLTLWGWIKLLTKPKLLSPAAAITGLATGLIGLGYLVHGAPSEAYFPAAVVLLPLMIAIGWATLDFKWRLVGSLNLILSLGLAVWGVWQSQWFVDQTTTWNYGPSLKTQQTALRWLNLTLKQPTFQVSSRDPGSEFDNYLAGYVWLGKGLNLEVNAKRNFITQDRVQISQVATQTHQMSFSDSARLTRFRPEYLDLPSLKLMIRP